MGDDASGVWVYRLDNKEAQISPARGSQLMRMALLAVLVTGAVGGATTVWNSDAPASQPRDFATRHSESAERVYLSRGPDFADISADDPYEIQSVLHVKKRLQHGDFLWNAASVPSGPVWVRVDLPRQIISVFRGGHEIGTAVILYGTKDKATPEGEFPILAKLKEHRSSLYGADMPYTLRLTGDGVAIHGSDVRWGAATHGCIGVPLEFAELLFTEIEIGDRVLIDA